MTEMRANILVIPININDHKSPANKIVFRLFHKAQTMLYIRNTPRTKCHRLNVKKWENTNSKK